MGALVDSLPELLLGIAGGIGSTMTVMFSSRARREQRFNDRYDQRFNELEAKVAECEKERPQLAVLTLGVSLLLPEVQRLSESAGQPNNPVLAIVADAFDALPHDKPWPEIIERLRREPGVNVVGGDDAGTTKGV